MTKNTPELRFKGFTDDWELRKFSGVIEKLSGGASIKPTDYLEDGIRTIPKGAVNATGIADLSGSKYISKDFFEKNITSHVHTNNLVTSLRDLVPSAPNMGRIVRIEGDDEQFLMPQGVYKLELLEGMDEDFLISFSNSDKYRKIISAEKKGSTQVHIRNGEFLNIDINLPSDHEQNKIGDFFKSLNHTLALHQRKLDLLKRLKQAYLQKMFPKSGEKVPEIHFAGFYENWEQRKLGELVRFYSGLTYSPQNIVSENGTFVLRSSNVKNGEIVDADNVYVNSSVVNADNVQKGDIIVVVRNGSRDLIGKHAQIKRTMNHTVIGAFMTGIRSKESNFINALLDTIQFKIEINKNLGATINQITTGSFKKMTFSITESRNEQEKIGLFFKTLDNTITQHQKYLDQLKSLKIAFLKKMFV
ncbi:restriction endonuclease subunit S [Enterococcus avium]|uniref:restriction endonuclease subunit S n=2 Tax=Enterococcus avium TaxID=33945 RepID=UPI00232FAF87|nr:restriction endonuclease subunit S [Enterococcus avium]MDB1737683.1 restriction endonuclease subunit S [Enterococcus avium]